MAGINHLTSLLSKLVSCPHNVTQHIYFRYFKIFICLSPYLDCSRNRVVISQLVNNEHNGMSRHVHASYPGGGEKLEDTPREAWMG